MDDRRTLAVDIGGTGIKLALLDGTGQMIGKRVRKPTPPSPVAPRTLTAKLFEEEFAGDEPDVVILRVEAHAGARVVSFTCVDHFDPATGMTAMMRTTAWPASVVVQMLASGEIAKRGAVRSELDIPAGAFLEAMARRGVRIEYSSGES